MNTRLKLFTSQSGAGLIEVMVSVLLLAVGVLGYIALQSVSIKSTSDSLSQTNILTNMRDLADQIRFNYNSMDEYTTSLDTYRNQFESSGSAAEPTDCSAQTCTATQQAQLAAYTAAQKAYMTGAKLAMVTCPGTAGNQIMETRCLIGSWNETEPTIGSDTDPSDGSMSCIDSSTGTYIRQSDCLILEVQ